MVRRVLQLAHQVAGHQHGTTLVGEGAQNAAHPHDPFGVEPVERLVEHQHRRVAQQRRRQPQPLSHPERVAARLAPASRLQADLGDDLVDTLGRQPLRMGEPHEVVAGACGSAAGRRCRAPNRRGGADAAGCDRAARRRAHVPSSAASRPRITRIVVDLPAPLGPTKPVTLPWATANVIPSRATVDPKRLRSPETSMVGCTPGTVRNRTRASSRCRAIFAGSWSERHPHAVYASCGGRQRAGRRATMLG